MPKPSMKLMEAISSDVCCLKFEFDQLLWVVFARHVGHERRRLVRVEALRAQSNWLAEVADLI